ncbi:MAG: response regulator, partial [Proteobacteria bacterium]|nr:response regulator [Pseudomonadota bacterium]
IPAFFGSAESRGIILYIEDNPANLMLMEVAIRRIGQVDIINAHTGEIGLSTIEAQKPDLVLLDINLPAMDGFEVLKRLRMTETGRALPVIGISANAMQHDIDRAMEAGFDAYVAKPFNIVELQNQVRGFLWGGQSADKA